MPEYRFSLTHTLLYNNKIYDSVLKEENKSQRNPVFGIFYAVVVTVSKYSRMDQVKFVEDCL